MAEEKTFEELSILYQENAKVAAIFWEWRHKVMTYFFTGIAALFVVAGWLYEKPKLEKFVSAPLALGVLLSAVSAILDWRNGQILKDCYSLGRELELEMRKEKGAIFMSLSDARSKRLTYTSTLRSAYILVGVMLLVLSVLALFF